MAQDASPANWECLSRLLSIGRLIVFRNIDHDGHLIMFQFDSFAEKPLQPDYAGGEDYDAIRELPFAKWLDRTRCAP